ncbi:MAG: NADH:flavin oxidoreductase/NADH oxidase [Burkholderiales bacterium]|nr:NADH:flavin oxidoreductase/NADH oxidase [Burkholderiales bacterium]
MSALFAPLQLRGLTVPNRIVVSQMCQYSATDGQAGDWHVMHLGNLAQSGAGMLFIEATAVEAVGRSTPGCLGLYDEACEAALQPVVASIRRHSPIALLMQIGHAGRKASSEAPWRGGQLIAPADGGWLPQAPSAIEHKAGEPPPLALDAAGLRRVRDAFADSARRAARLGLDGLELHAAHGYLLHQFLSPIANEREDDYGGSLAKRMRFPLEVFDAVRAAFPADKPVGVRVSCTDWVDGGWDLAQTLEFAKALKQRGVDWIDASSGGVSPLQKIALGPGYQVPFAQAIKQATGLATMAVGLITQPRQAEDIVASGQADLVALARAMLLNPRWGWQAAMELGDSVDAAPPYWRAPPHGHAGMFKRTLFGAR